jgi:hypothetical protein
VQISYFTRRLAILIKEIGLYSWFSHYDQACLSNEDCQEKAVQISQSTDTWLYNLVTKGVVEMVSPVNEPPTLSADNVNGFMSSIIAWVRMDNATIDTYFLTFQTPKVAVFVQNSTVTDYLCSSSCGASLEQWFNNVNSNCANQTLGETIPTLIGGYIWEGFNQTCLKNPSTGQYCTGRLSLSRKKCY